MFLPETSLWAVVKRQYFYKLKANIGLFLNMISLQALALLFSLGGVGGSGGSGDYISYSTKFFSANIIIIFTIAWAYIAAIMLTSKANRNTDFTFVSNRLSSNLANIAFLVSAGIIGGVTAILSGFILRVIVYFYNGFTIAEINFFVAPSTVLINIMVTTLYILLVGALGYLFGMLVQLNRALLMILPTLLAGFIFVEANFHGGSVTTLIKVVSFFGRENSLSLFTMKVIMTVVIIFGCAICISNRLEVRD